MRNLSTVLAVAGMLASVTAGAADTALLGESAPVEQSQRTIVITPLTKFVNVTEGDVVKFVSNGQTFAYSFDSPFVDSFLLNDVAPAGVLDHPVTAYVEPGPDQGF